MKKPNDYMKVNIRGAVFVGCATDDARALEAAPVGVAFGEGVSRVARTAAHVDLSDIHDFTVLHWLVRGLEDGHLPTKGRRAPSQQRSVSKHKSSNDQTEGGVEKKRRTNSKCTVM